ncbi:MAG: hypothetical protein QOI53_1572, partial [Verrucomicrobiota bacterium]|nr:hypothetical protein [Verrucomicrobiota bacterium]
MSKLPYPIQTEINRDGLPTLFTYLFYLLED